MSDQARRACGSEHDEIRRRLEATGGAHFELPAGHSPAPQADKVRAGERVRLQRPGDAELMLRKGVIYDAATGTVVMPGAVPEWAKESIVAAYNVIARLEMANAKLRVRSGAEPQAQGQRST